MLLLIDLTRANDNVKRGKLFGILRERSVTEVDKHIVYLIEQLYHKQTITVGKERVETHLGLAQGEVLSPELFNVYLEAALNSSHHIKLLINEGNLSAYADDIICDLWGVYRTKLIIKELHALGPEWNLVINLKKCEILTLTDKENVEGIKCSK